MCEWCVKTEPSTSGSEGFNPHSTCAPRFLDKVDKIYPQPCAQWVVMVGETYLDNKENDTLDHRDANVNQGKNLQNPKSGRIGEENPCRMGWKGYEDQLCY